MVKRNLPYKEFLALNSKAHPETGCLLWTGHITNIGYGRINFRRGGKRYCVMAHRLSYEQFVGPVPDAMELDHLCRNRACINPSHLEPVTAYENQMRGAGFAATNAKKTECRNGHVLPPHQKGTNRRCRECRRIYIREWMRRKRESGRVQSASKPKK